MAVIRKRMDAATTAYQAQPAPQVVVNEESIMAPLSVPQKLENEMTRRAWGVSFVTAPGRDAAT
jgi:hypothetical protein